MNNYFATSIGYSAGPDFFMNHVLSRQSNVNDIACLNQPNSPWSNVVYKVNEAQEQRKEGINIIINQIIMDTIMIVIEYDLSHCHKMYYYYRYLYSRL